MKLIFFKRLLAVVIFTSMCLSGYAQEKFGGLTLYTLRKEMSADPQETLKKVADVGYKYIEVANYNKGMFYKMSPKEFKKALKKLDMVPLSAHMGMVTLDNADKLIADVKAAGFKYFVAPVPPMGHFKYDAKTKSVSMSEDLEELTDILNTLGKKCKEAGLEFLYHNHNFEFEKNKNGIVPIDYFLENLNPEYVNFEVDLYWVAKAGADPIAYFKKYPGRFVVWHVKDMDDQGRFAPVGAGSIDFAKLLENKDAAGMKYYIVEQDQTFDDMDPFEAIKISYEGLKKFGFK